MQLTNLRREITRREVRPEQEAPFPQDMHPVLRRVFAARGVGPEQLDASLSALIPVSELAGTQAAAERLAAARVAQQRILILGDYDADGATATAVMMQCLHAFGYTQVSFLVPDRQRYGYGLSAPLVELAAEQQPDLIVTVDNGISSHSGVAAANARGIDVIVTDHHLPGETLPDAAVIVNPNAPGNGFTSKVLAGVGVAFYVMAALGQRLAADGHMTGDEARRLCADCLDLVALGTVADLVPLDANNRILVAQGLARMRNGTSRPGIRALFEVAGRNIFDAATGDLGFALAPRLNAAGRLTDMTVGINCLLAETPAEALALARQLSTLNEQRRDLQADMQEQADRIIDRLEAELGGQARRAVCLYEPDWHQGVVGLVATRIRERLNRPAIAFAPGEGGLKGSGRSVPGIHLRDVLAVVDTRNPGLIDKYGGHAMAAGLSLAPDKLADFDAAFVAAVEEQAHRIDDIDRLWSDGELGPDDLTLSMADALRHAAPWGQGFPEPAFDGSFEIVEQRIVGDKHLKLRVRPVGSRQSIEGIAFNHPELVPDADDRSVRLYYRLDVNEFRNIRSQQLVVQHIESD